MFQKLRAVVHGNYQEIKRLEKSRRGSARQAGHERVGGLRGSLPGAERAAGDGAGGVPGCFWKRMVSSCVFASGGGRWSRGVLVGLQDPSPAKASDVRFNRPAHYWLCVVAVDQRDAVFC